jgi:uncharacterized protein YgfB (UPF0149 family)
MHEASYGDLDSALDDAGSDVDAAEAHGCLCGALCAEATFPTAEWAAEILPDDEAEPLPQGVMELLEGIRESTLASLAGGEMAFEPMLPLDTGPLDSRVQALATWCGGFLYGLGRIGALRQLPGDLDEILADFSEISRASVGPGEGGEQGERDYAELVEFVRAGVQLAWEELAPRRAAQSVGAAGTH